MLEFEVSKHSIYVAIEIPYCGEKWLKAMSLNSSLSKEFFKLEYQGDNLDPKECLEVTCWNIFTRCSGSSKGTSHVKQGSIWYINTISNY
jgi:hypothetical protein